MNTRSADTALLPSRLGAAGSGSRSRLAVVGALALLLAATSAIASAHPGGGGHGGGGGHSGGGGGGHPAAGGGGGHFSGGAHYSGGAAAYRAAPRFSYGSRGGSFNGGFVNRAPAYSPARSGALTARTGIAPRAPIAYGGFNGSRGGVGGAGGFHYRPWNGGYWHGHYWPAVYYGADFAWFLPVLPAYCVPYWWGGIPYYYYNDAYYTWDAGDGGYVASEPPPVADDSDAQSPEGAAPPPSSDAGDGGNEYGAPGYGAQAPYPPPPGAGSTDPNAAAATTGAAGEAEQGAPIPDMSGNLYAYPKNGQSAEQQNADRRACAQWAASQAPETADGNSIDYKRALTACLTGRGYSVD
jgi:hypothetical protein